MLAPVANPLHEGVRLVEVRFVEAGLKEFPLQAVRGRCDVELAAKQGGFLLGVTGYQRAGHSHSDRKGVGKGRRDARHGGDLLEAIRVGSCRDPRCLLGKTGSGASDTGGDRTCSNSTQR